MGRLGKPQKSQKHKKIKASQPMHKERLERIKKKLPNQKPRSDEQEIPYKVRMIMENKNKYRQNTPKKKTNERVLHNKKGGTKDIVMPMERGMIRPMEPAPVFRQSKMESDRQFMNRVDKEAQIVISKAKLEDKYKVQLHESKDGHNMSVKRSMSERRKEKLKERKSKKMAKKKEKILEKKGDYEAFSDKVEFGEVVMHPPSLTAKPRKTTDDPTAAIRPGKRSLLLKEIINHNAALNTKSVTSNRQIGQIIKRKNLSVAQKRVMDMEREKAIETYRQLKAKKQKLS